MESNSVLVNGSQKPTYLNGRHMSLYTSAFTARSGAVVAMAQDSSDDRESLLLAA